jgi:glucan 1,3-beta-glucosidase
MEKLHGVNLGGWLVLERWITPSLFEGIDALDEYNFCEQLGAAAHEKLKIHRDTFITEDDFKWIKAHKLNAARIPIGYWIFGDYDPFMGGIEYLDFALDCAAKNGIKVIIDLHGAPGSQNGWKHSGKEGSFSWHKNPQNIEATIKIVEKLAQRYKQHPSLAGIELLNEPRWEVPINTLVNYYQHGYASIRRHCGKSVAVIVSDSFRPYAWQDVLLKPEYENIWLDCHLYQVFNKDDKKLDLNGHLNKAKNEWGGMIQKLQETHPVIVGEWSAALNPETLAGMEESEKISAAQEYFSTQIATFSHTKGWFYWNYKTENESAWCLRCMMDKELLSF